jgi:putative endonuclease
VWPPRPAVCLLRRRSATGKIRAGSRQNGDTAPRRHSYLVRVTKTTDAFGELGERIAVRWLERAGWRILSRRYRSGRRDIDVVAERDGLIAFVEVKARTGEAFGSPVEAVHRRKQRELAKSAQTWIDRHGRTGESYRFDVMGVLLKERRVYIRHIPGAFQLQ